MTQVRDVVGYVCRNKPEDHRLTRTRLMRVVYLSDWRAALELGRQITNLTWTFDTFGPYSPELNHIVKTDPAFVIDETTTRFGEPKDVVEVAEDADFLEPSPEDKRLLDSVLSATKNRDFAELAKLVYSTFPILTGHRGSRFDLVSLALEYREHGQSPVMAKT